jgi:hypothetical protein
MFAKALMVTPSTKCSRLISAIVHPFLSLQVSPAKSRSLNNLGWKLFNALFPRTLESFARRFAAKYQAEYQSSLC